MRHSLRRMEEAPPATRLPKGLATFSAFETALSMIPQPTFVIGRGGEILHANAPGEQLLAQERVDVQRSLVQAVHGEPHDRAWRLTQLGAGLPPPGFIAVLDPLPPRSGSAEGLLAGAFRWKLTARQSEVLDLVARGATNAAIAETLGIKERTVEFHLSALFDKAGVDNRATLIVRLLAL
jgi:DNA-binding CsgD family transcriptional regulator